MKSLRVHSAVSVTRLTPFFKNIAFPAWLAAGLIHWPSLGAKPEAWPQVGLVKSSKTPTLSPPSSQSTRPPLATWPVVVSCVPVVSWLCVSLLPLEQCFSPRQFTRGLAPHIAALELLYLQALLIPTANTYWWFLQHTLKMCFLLSISGATTLFKLFLSQCSCNVVSAYCKHCRLPRKLLQRQLSQHVAFVTSHHQCNS